MRTTAKILFLALVAALVGGRCDRRPEAPGVVHEPTGRSVLLFGMDGLDWRVATPLLDAGEMPHLARLIAGGASGKLTTFLPTHSPIIWTSIITGREMRDHGILSFWHRVPRQAEAASEADQRALEQLRALGYVDGGGQEMVLYGSGSRRVKALWNILTEQGMTTDSVGWWVTHPPEPIRGRMISDRYLYNRFRLAAAERGERYEGRNAVHPPELEEAIRPLVQPYDLVEPEEMQQFIRGEVSIGDSLKLHAVEDELRIVYAKDESTLNIARMLLDGEMPDLFCLYIQGTDVASHYFWKYRWPGEWMEKYGETIPESELARYGQVIDSYYRLQDRHLGELLERVDLSRTTLVLVSDHGFVTGKRDQKMRGAASTISGVHGAQMPPGFILMAGAGVRGGAALEGAHVFDVAPTVLTLLGLPVASDMDGRVLTEALDESVISDASKIRTIPTYEGPGG